MSEEPAAKKQRTDNPFLECTDRTDTILHVEGWKLYVSSVILAESSTVFEAMLYGSFEESITKEVDLVGKNLEDVVLFLKCLHPSKKPSFKEVEKFEGLLKLCQEYDVQWLTKDIERYLITREVKPTNQLAPSYKDSDVLYRLYLASEFDLVEVEENFRSYTFQKEYSELHKNPYFEKLTKEWRYQILKSYIKKKFSFRGQISPEWKSMSEEMDLLFVTD